MMSKKLKYLIPKHNFIVLVFLIRTNFIFFVSSDYKFMFWYRKCLISFLKISQNYFCKKVFAVFVLVLFCFSCSKNIASINNVFEKKYGEEVEKIRASRTPPKDSVDKNAKLNFALPTSENINSFSNIEKSDYEQYYANVDLEEYNSVQPKEFLPDSASYEQAKLTPENLPKNMFEINYITTVSPPFKRSGIDFDLINIPNQDFYGIKTAMTTKEYLLIGNDSLQKDIDYINQNKSSKEIEMTKILVKEQRQIRRNNKMIRVFGEQDSNLSKK
jgi:hypothetical protein